MADFTGTTGNDTQNGTNAGDNFFYQHGGRDTLNGKGGNDAIQMGTELRANDRINGGSGLDTVHLSGATVTPYAVVFDDNTIINCEVIQMNAGNYSVTIADGNIAAGEHLSVLSSAATSMFFDGSAETDGFFTMDTSAGDDTLIGGAMADTLGGGTPHFSPAGIDTLRGGGGDDRLIFWDDLTPDDRANGGDGFDTLTLDGDYSAEVVMQSGTLSGIERIVLDGLDAADIYYLTFADGNVAGGEMLTVDASAADGVFLNGAAETNGQFTFYGGVESDVMAGGAKDDVIQGNGGNDLIGGGGGNDLFVYPLIADSTSTEHDHVVDFNANQDAFAVPTPVTGIDAAVNNGTLNNSNFDVRLAGKIDAGKLAANHAVLYKPSAGDFAGVQFLIVDCNGAAGYQTGEDIVLRLITPTHLSGLDTGNFFSL